MAFKDKNGNWFNSEGKPIPPIRHDPNRGLFPKVELDENGDRVFPPVAGNSDTSALSAQNSAILEELHEVKEMLNALFWDVASLRRSHGLD